MRFTGIASAVVVSTLIIPGTGSISTTGIAPRNDRAVVGTVGALALQGYAPTVTVPGGTEITPPAGSLVFTGLASWNDRGIIPTTGALSLEGYAPAVVVPGQTNITPSVGTLAFLGTSPTVTETSISSGAVDMPTMPTLPTMPTIRRDL